MSVRSLGEDFSQKASMVYERIFFAGQYLRDDSVNACVQSDVLKRREINYKKMFFFM